MKVAPQDHNVFHVHDHIKTKNITRVFKIKPYTYYQNYYRIKTNLRLHVWVWAAAAQQVEQVD